MTTPPPSGAAAGQDADDLQAEVDAGKGAMRLLAKALGMDLRSVSWAEIVIRVERLTRTPSPSEAQPCGLSWRGFNVYGDESSIAAVRTAVHEADMVPKLKEEIRRARSAHPAPSPSEAQPVAWRFRPRVQPPMRWRIVNAEEAPHDSRHTDWDYEPLYAHPAPSPSEGVREAVPREPTEAMMLAANCAPPYGEKGFALTDRDRRFYSVVWRAMYDAALASSTVEETPPAEGAK